MNRVEIGNEVGEVRLYRFGVFRCKLDDGWASGG